MNDHKSITVRSPTGLDAGDRDAWKGKAAEKGVEAVASIVELLVEGGRVYLDAKRLEAQAAKGWEDTNQLIARLDAETRKEVALLGAKLQTAKEKTTRLQMVLDVIAGRGASLPEAYAAGLSKAVENLTREP